MTFMLEVATYQICKVVPMMLQELIHDSNDGNYTKITIIRHGILTDLKGFQISLNSVKGYKLYDDNGSQGYSYSDNLSKTNITDGSVIYSQLNGTHEIVKASWEWFCSS